MNDKLLAAIIAFQSGDKDAFEEIYRLQYNHVYYIAFKYAKTKEAAEDVLQDVFIEVYRSLHNLDTPEYFIAWINKVVYTSFIRTVRSKQTTMRVHLAEDTIDLFAYDEDQYSPDELYHHKEALEAVETVFNDMTVELQEVARMRFFDELSLKEIANILKIPEGTVKSRVNRVRTLVQERLNISDYKFRMDATLAIALFFKVAINSINTPAAADISQRVGIVATAAAVAPKKSINKKTVGGSAAVVGVIGLSFLIRNNASIDLLDYHYDKQWTRDSVAMAIDLSDNTNQTDRLSAKLNGNELKIHFLEGDYHININANGTLTFSLDDEPLFEEVIDNIDTVGPVVSLLSQESIIKLSVDDDLSGVVWESLKVVDEFGTKVDYTLQDAILSFASKDNRNYVITGRDLAGNTFESKVNYVAVNE